MAGITWQQAALALTIILTSYGSIAYTDLFGVIFNLKGMDYNYTGDTTCGSECESYINLTTSYWRVCFANYSDTKYENETLFKKRSRSRTLHVNMNNINNIITTKKKIGDNLWLPYDIEVDWMVPTYGKKWRPIKDGDCWDRKKINKIKLIGHKNPEDTIKWSFGLGIDNSYVDIDPVWNAGLTFVTEEIFTGYIEEPNEYNESHDYDENEYTELINVSQYVTMSHWLYNTSEYTLKVPNDARCIVKDNNTVDCSLTVDIEYKLNKPLQTKDFNVGLAFEKRPLTKKNATLNKGFEVAQDKISDFVTDLNTPKEITLKNIKTLTKGNHTLTYEFEYPMFTQDKFNITLFDVEIDPIVSGCMVITSSGTYTMNQSISNSGTSYCMNISANNVTLDCAGYTIDGDDAADYGIFIKRASDETTNITVKNCIVTDWDTGALYIHDADSNVIDNMSFSSHANIGIYIHSSNLNTISNTNVTSGDVCVKVDSSHSTKISNLRNSACWTGVYVLNSMNAEITDSTLQGNKWCARFTHIVTGYCNAVLTNVYDVMGDAIVYYNTTVNLQNWNNNFSQITLCNADNSVLNNMVTDANEQNHLIDFYFVDDSNITNSEFKDGERSIYFEDSHSNIVENVTVTSSVEGVYLETSNSNLFTNVTFSSNTNGLYGRISNYNKILNSEVYSNTNDGLYLDGDYYEVSGSTIYLHTGSQDTGLYFNDDDNLIYNNTIYSNYYGIQLDTTATNNTLYNNTIHSNTYGLYMDGAGSGEVNLIYNNIFNQTSNVKFQAIFANNWNTTKQTGTRIYSDGTEIGGNYWTNSTGGISDTCADSDTDGFCDDTYTLETGNIDYLPLSNKYAITENPRWSDNSTNSTAVGENVLFSVFWNSTDGANSNMSAYIFGWYNGVNWSQISSSGDQELGTQNEVASAGGGTALNIFDGFESSFAGNFTDAKTNGNPFSNTDSWTRDSSGTPSSNTGPSTGSDSSTWYVFVETSTAECYTAGEDAVVWMSDLISWNDQTGEQIEFDYHMYGANIGKLSLEENSTGSWVELWSKTGQQSTSYTDWKTNTTVLSSLTGTGNLRFWYECAGNWAGDAALDGINITSSGGGESNNDTNKSAIVYSDIISDLYDQVDNITVTVNVSYYNTTGSIENANANATLWLEVYNGTVWIDEGNFGVGTTQSTGNYSITVTTASVLIGWATETNRDLRISARLVDYNDSTHYDEINWTDVSASISNQGKFKNDSAVLFTDGMCTTPRILCWSNITKIITSTGSATVEWYVWGNTTNNKGNTTDEFSFVTTGAAADTTKPTYSNNGHNTTTAGADILFYLEYNDDTALHPDGQYIFSTNNTGEWANESAVNFTATPNWANVSKTLNSTVSQVVGYRWYADDNAGNINNTGIFALTTTTADTCSCPGLATNWEINPSDYCVIVDCNISTGNITYTADTGNVTFTGILTYNQMENIHSNLIVWVKSTAVLWRGYS